MKNLIKIIVFLIPLNIQFIFTQENSAVNFFPLNVGNVWLYVRDQPPYIPPGPGKDLVRVEDSSLIGGHIYYHVRGYTYNSFGNLEYSNLGKVRVDSVSGNILIYENGSVCLVDSLKSELNDSAYSTCEVRWRKCLDTNSMNMFGQLFNARIFMWSNYFEQGKSSTYLNGLGKVSMHYYCPQCSQHWGLIGCVVKGVLYGDTAITSINLTSSEVPERFALSQNYPNPFNPTTNIKFQISKSEIVKLTIYDILGKEIQILVNQELSPGAYSVDFDGSNLPSGVYYYKIETVSYIKTKKMVLIK